MNKCYDYSMLSCFQACKRKFYFRYVRHLVGTKRQTALEFGTSIHAALEVWSSTQSVDQALKAFDTSWAEAGGDAPDDAKRTKAMADKVLKGYFKKYAQEPFEIVSTETPFEINMGNYMYIGRMDKVIKWDDVIGPMDHKTSSSLGYSTFDQYNPNMQVDGYIYACQKCLDPNAYMALMDVILIAKTKQEYARSKETRSQEQIDAFPQLFLEVIAEIEQAEKTGKYTPCYGQCSNYGNCPYRMLCTESPKVWEDLIAGYFKEEVWDPRKDVKEDKILKVEVK